MLSLVSLLVAAALVSQQCGFEVNAQIDESKISLDNSLQPNVVASPRRSKPHRRLNKYVRIWSAPATDLRRLAGDSLVLDCTAMGNPPPTIYWMKNGQTIQDPSEDMNQVVPAVGLAQLHSKLVITTSEPGEDEYACVAEAGLKRATAVSTVTTMPTDDDEEDLLALEKLFFATKPIITYSYDELFQELGSAALLPCRVHSRAPAQVLWRDKHDRPIYGNPRIRVMPSGDLMISSLLWSDMGNFTCVAKNMYGVDSTFTFVYPIKP